MKENWIKATLPRHFWVGTKLLKLSTSTKIEIPLKLVFINIKTKTLVWKTNWNWYITLAKRKQTNNRQRVLRKTYYSPQFKSRSENDKSWINNVCTYIHTLASNWHEEGRETLDIYLFILWMFDRWMTETEKTKPVYFIQRLWKVQRHTCVNNKHVFLHMVSLSILYLPKASKMQLLPYSLDVNR